MVSDHSERGGLVLRLTLPYDEDAPLYVAAAEGNGYFAGAGDVVTYLPDELRRIVERYDE